MLNVFIAEIKQPKRLKKPCNEFTAEYIANHSKDEKNAHRNKRFSHEDG